MDEEMKEIVAFLKEDDPDIESKIKTLTRERCFADRKDRTCHALVKKECEHCKFYTPRSKVKNNVFYRWSWDNDYRFNKEFRKRRIELKDVMRRNDQEVEIMDLWDNVRYILINAIMDKNNNHDVRKILKQNNEVYICCRNKKILPKKYLSICIKIRDEKQEAGND